jgi:hypothetical protein
MKQLFLLAVPLLAVSACAPQQPPPPAPVAQPVPAPTATNATTTAFDGTYGNAVVTAKSAPGCPDLNLPPNLTITNGVAALQGPNLAFGGYVTPQGALAMSSPSGLTFAGQIDSRFVLTGRVSGPNCTYNITWNRAS